MIDKPAALLILVLASFSGCVSGTSTQKNQGPIVLATTTSTYDSGLLDFLLPKFEEKYGIDVKVISVGTGQALEIGRRGDADVILVHSPSDEERFVEEGFGIQRHCIMYNDFVIVGPTDDSAHIKNYSVVEALGKIPGSGSVFISRGDGSGTHKKEHFLWNLTGIEAREGWYLETGLGMGQTLLAASEMKGYTLTDRGTFATMKKRLNLSILVSGERVLLNPYGIMAVSQIKNPGVNQAEGELLIQWITSDEGQALIGGYNKEGEQLFTPLYGRCLED